MGLQQAQPTPGTATQSVIISTTMVPPPIQKRPALLAVLVSFLPGSLLAGPTNLVSLNAAPGPSGLTALIHMLGALAVTFAVFFGALWVWRHGQHVLRPRGKAAKLAVLEAKSLGQRHTIYVIGYEEQRMLVSTSPNGVSLLASLPPGKPATEPEPETAKVTPAGGFGALLLQAITHRT